MKNYKYLNIYQYYILLEKMNQNIEKECITCNEKNKYKNIEGTKNFILASF